MFGFRSGGEVQPYAAAWLWLHDPTKGLLPFFFLDNVGSESDVRMGRARE